MCDNLLQFNPRELGKGHLKRHGHYTSIAAVAQEHVQIVIPGFAYFTVLQDIKLDILHDSRRVTSPRPSTTHPIAEQHIQS